MTLTDAGRIQAFLQDLDRDIHELVDDGYSETPSAQNSRLDESDHPKSVAREDAHEWCERSLEELEITIHLLDQCLDNDLTDLGRQQGVINLCAEEVRQLKKAVSQ
jgi:hypothetical protein